MSFDYDSYQQGQRLGEMGGFAASRALSRANSTIDEWEANANQWQAYARKLESQLAQANLNHAQAAAACSANNEVLRELRQHVLAINPRDPMVQPGVVAGKIHRKIRETVLSQGYRIVNEDTLAIAAR